MQDDNPNIQKLLARIAAISSQAQGTGKEAERRYESAQNTINVIASIIQNSPEDAPYRLELARALKNAKKAAKQYAGIEHIAQIITKKASQALTQQNPKELLYGVQQIQGLMQEIQTQGIEGNNAMNEAITVIREVQSTQVA